MWKTITDLRVVLTVHVVGMSALSAFELGKAEAERLWVWEDLAEALFEAAEPEEIEGGVIDVSVLVGVTELEPADAVRSACAVLADRTWSEPAVRTIPEHQYSYWEPETRPERGLVRVEVHAAPGLAPVSEGQRQDMLDDPDFAHLHDVLRML